jgi:TrmH RNA methyltransferase
VQETRNAPASVPAFASQSGTRIGASIDGGSRFASADGENAIAREKRCTTSAPVASRRPHPPRRQPPRPPEPSAAPGQIELIQGLRAGLATFAKRPDDVQRVLYTHPVRRDVADLERWATARGIPCDEASAAEIDALVRSMRDDGGHHEGLVLVTRPRRWTPPRDFAEALVRERGAAVAIDRVRNPYNVGAVLRSASFFGLYGALFGAQTLPSSSGASGLASSAVRVAEGGVEHLALARTTDLGDTLARMRERGIRVIGADGHATTAATGFKYGRPVVLVMGHEREGLGERVRAQCDAIVAIPGGGKVDSLNVAVAAGVIMAMMMRA